MARRKSSAANLEIILLGICEGRVSRARTAKEAKNRKARHQESSCRSRDLFKAQIPLELFQRRVVRIRRGGYFATPYFPQFDEAWLGHQFVAGAIERPDRP